MNKTKKKEQKTENIIETKWYSDLETIKQDRNRRVVTEA